MKKEFANRIKEKAKRLADDDTKISKLLDEVKEKLGGIVKSERLNELFSTIEVFIRMLKSYINGEYRDYPKRSLTLILFGLIYFLIPLDMIPDFIPITGFLDDLTVILWIFRSIQKDIIAYLDWEQGKTSTTN